MPHYRYPLNCYKMLKDIDISGRWTWAMKVKELLFRYGFGYVWIAQDVGDIDMFLRAFKQRLTD